MARSRQISFSIGPPLWFDRLVASPQFQSLVSRLPFVRSLAKREGAVIFDVLQGFVASQVLFSLVELGLLQRLLDCRERALGLALATGIPEERLQVLLTAGVALGLLRRQRDGRYGLARRGAAILGVPGLQDIIAHNAALYGDLADPIALLRDPGETRLARFWPYVMQGAQSDDVQARRYSDLMARSQRLVAEDTLRQTDLGSLDSLMDVGGGSGAFLSEALKRYPNMSGCVLDLPEVVPAAKARLELAGVGDRVTVVGRSFREGALPKGADAISLVRVLYDHADPTVEDLLARVFDALPPGGRLIVSEPMSGGARPDRTTDVYFAFYTMAMGTGCVRSAERIGELCRAAGFSNVRAPRPARSYITSVLTCVKPA